MHLRTMLTTISNYNSYNTTQEMNAIESKVPQISATNQEGNQEYLWTSQSG